MVVGMKGVLGDSSRWRTRNGKRDGDVELRVADRDKRCPHRVGSLRRSKSVTPGFAIVATEAGNDGKDGFTKFSRARGP